METWRRNDTQPPFRMQITNEKGYVEPLVGITSVNFTMVSVDGGIPKVLSQAATVEDADNAIIMYDWQAGNTDTAGYWECQIEAFAGAEKKSYCRVIIYIEADLNGT